MTGLGWLWLACAPVDPVEGQRATWEAQRVLLRAAESERVLAALAHADDEERAQMEALAAQLGLIEAAPPGGVRPLDGREVGVTFAHGQAVLAGVREEFRVAVDEALWTAAARDELGVDVGATPEEVVRAALAGGLPPEEAVVRGVEAALAALDPYTRPVWPAEVAAWTAHMAGVQVGVGVDLLATDGALVVSGLHPQGAGWAGGLHVGDRVLAIDGESVGSLVEARGRLAGPPGTEVGLRVLRAGAEHTATLERRALPEITVTGERRRPDQGFDVEVGPGVAYLRIAAFRPGTDEELLELAGEGPWEAVILDLRGNPGGDVQAALNVVDAWLDGGILVEMSGRRAPRPEPPGEGEAAWNQAVPGGPFVGARTAVLVDQDTASAAEIVAGALQQLAGATVIGAPTTGKGLSQALRADEGLGVAWQVTNFAWSLPDGRVLAPGWGIEPDQAVIPTPAERWQIARMAAQREALAVHADGSPAGWVGAAVHPAFPQLGVDVGRFEAWTWAGLSYHGEGRLP